jgi:hypothetical protein
MWSELRSPAVRGRECSLATAIGLWVPIVDVCYRPIAASPSPTGPETKEVGVFADDIDQRRITHTFSSDPEPLGPNIMVGISEDFLVNVSG